MPHSHLPHSLVSHKKTPHKQTLAIAMLGGAMTIVSLTACAADAVDTFATAPGFAEVDYDSLVGDDYYSAERFPGSGASVFMPDADLVAPVRAMLMMDAHEAPVQHSRYLVTYDLHSDRDDPYATSAQVEITRINLGEAFREDAMQGVPLEHQGPPEAFGIGPHVSWRFDMSPIQGMSSHVVKASRRELSDAAVAKLDCLGAPCAQLDSPEGPDGDWLVRDQPGPSVDYRAVTVEGPAPAYVVDQMLSVMMGEDGPRPTGPADPQRKPQFTFVVSVNAGGQDVMTTGLGRDSVVFDDAIGTVWVKTSQFSDTPGEISELQQARSR